MPNRRLKNDTVPHLIPWATSQNALWAIFSVRARGQGPSKACLHFTCVRNSTACQGSSMHNLPTLLLVAALGCFGFSYWGLNTVSGRGAFDEMAGMIPLAAAPVGILLLLCAAVLWWRRRTP